MNKEDKQNQETENSDQGQILNKETQDDKSEQLEQKISELEEKNRTLNDKFLRLAAELENMRRRNNEELEKANKYAISNFAGDLVLVLENFYLASDNLPDQDIEKSSAVKHFADAMIMTKKELTKILEKYKIKRIYPLGEKFDHNFHEAISNISAEGEDEDGVVKQVVQAGYSIGERLIRPALVVVINKS